MKWFGKSWGAPVCEPARQVATPAGEACAFCDMPIAEAAQGVLMPHMGKEEPTWRPWHLDCFLRSLGIEGHLVSSKVLRRLVRAAGVASVADPADFQHEARLSRVREGEAPDPADHTIQLSCSRCGATMRLERMFSRREDMVIDGCDKCDPYAPPLAEADPDEAR